MRAQHLPVKLEGSFGQAFEFILTLERAFPKGVNPIFPKQYLYACWTIDFYVIKELPFSHVCHLP